MEHTNNGKEKYGNTRFTYDQVRRTVEDQNKFMISTIKKWKQEAGVKTPILFELRSDERGVLYIWSTHPGLLIGKNGVLCNKYEAILRKGLGRAFRRVYFTNVEGYAL